MSNKFVNNSAFSLVNNLLQLLVSLGSGMIIARFLGVRGKGEIYLIVQVSTMIQIIFSFGLGSSLLFFLKKKEINYNQANTFVIIYSMLITGLFYILLLIFGKSIGNILGGDISLKFLVLSFLLALFNISSSFIGYTGMAEDNGMKWWNIVSFVSNIFYLIMLVLLVCFFRISTIGVVYVLLASVIIKLILLIRPLIKLSFKFEFVKSAQFWKLFVFGFQIFIGSIFLTSVFRIDTFFLNKMVNISQLGIYSVAVSVGELLLLIPNAIGFVLFPHLSGLGREEQRGSMCMIGRVSFVIGIVGISGLAIIGYPLILVIFGKNFIPAFYPFLTLLPGLFAMTLNYSYSNYFSSIGQPLTGAYIFCIGLMVNIAFNIILIPHFGILAAAFNSSISYLIITIGFIVKIKSEDNLSLRDFVFPKLSDFIYVKNKLKPLIFKN